MIKSNNSNKKNKNFLTLLMADDKIGNYIIYILFFLIILLPFLHIVPDEESVFYINGYTISLLGKYLCFALLALSLDLVWGYTGILSLGHGAFFGLGGYMMGMHLMREIGDR